MIATTTVPPSDLDVAQDAEVLEGQHRHLRVGDRGGADVAERRSAVAHHRPDRVRAGDDLHLGEHPAQRLGVQPVAAGAAADAGQRRPVGPRRRRSARGPARAPRRPRRRRSPGRRRRRSPRRRPRRRGSRTSRRTAATARSARLEAAPRLVGALGEGEEPAAGVVAVVGQLLDALGRDRGQHVVAAVRRAARTARAGRSRTAAAGRSSCAKSPLATSASRTLRNSPASRKNASASSGGTGEPSGSAGTTDGSAAAARASSSRAWPSRSSAMLASAMSSSRSGASAAPLARAGARATSASSAEHQAVRRERRGGRRRPGTVVSTPASGSSKSVPNAHCEESLPSSPS